MNNILTKQYNNWADEHDTMTLKYDKKSRESFYSFFNFETKEKSLLDIACGSGHDLKYYQTQLGCDVWGVDASEKEVDLANKRLSKKRVKVGYSDALPYEDNSFDIVVSKYAPQGFEDIASFYKEVTRVLKPGGYFLILTTHPMRHFLEKKGNREITSNKKLLHLGFMITHYRSRNIATHSMITFLFISLNISHLSNI